MNLCCGSNLSRQRLPAHGTEILDISYKEASLMNLSYNIEFASKLFIDKRDNMVTYSLVKSDLVQSVVFQEVLLVSAIHQSLCMGKQYCYKIFTKCQRFIVFKAKSEKERDYWIKQIRCAINDVSDFIITEENSLKICIQECRNLSATNRYFCEVRLDDMICARTSVKEMRDICFWGEEFDLTGLSDIKLVSITIWRLPKEKERERPPQIVSHVNIDIDSINRHCIKEKWYSPSPVYVPNLINIPHNTFTFSVACDLECPPDTKLKDKTLPNQVLDSAPLLRIKSRYFPLKVLDSKFYLDILHFLDKNAVDLFREIDVNMKAKYREELLLPMVQLCIRNDWIEEFLSELIVKESRNCDVSVILRGNNIATKAMECFLKIECGDYLRDILGELIQNILYCHNDLEIDRVRLLKSNMSVSTSSMRRRVKRLEKLVEEVLTKIFNSIDFIPRRVKTVFNMIRVKIKSNEVSNSDFIEKVISACFFLRLVCPAIMTPYLFQLLPDYSQNADINRSFTLTAKCVQNVANFAGINDQKEEYMQSMVLFCRDYYEQMHLFLENISKYEESSTVKSISRNNSPDYDLNGFGMEMARLCYHMDYCLHTFVNEQPTSLENKAKYLLSQLKRMEKQLSAGHDMMDLKYDVSEFLNSGKPVENTTNSEEKLFINDYPIYGVNNLFVSETNSLQKECYQIKQLQNTINKSYLPSHHIQLKKYEDVDSFHDNIQTKTVGVEEDTPDLLILCNVDVL